MVLLFGREQELFLFPVFISSRIKPQPNVGLKCFVSRSCYSLHKKLITQHDGSLLFPTLQTWQNACDNGNLLERVGHGQHKMALCS